MKTQATLSLLLLSACIVDSKHHFATDNDGDGYTAFDGDCNDVRADIFPGADETCDDLDNDCDGLVDEEDGTLDWSSAQTFYADADSDGFGDAAQPIVSCYAGPDAVSNLEDCDDAVATTHPGAAELCDLVDNDCDGLVDQADPDVVTSQLLTWYLDADGDGYGTNDTIQACFQPPGYCELAGDCNDANSEVNPGQVEQYNDTVDSNCDGLDDPLDGTDNQDNDMDGYSELQGDCNDSDPNSSPTATDLVGDGIDQNCDGVDGMDLDGDGFASAVSGGLDCDDADAAVYPGGPDLASDGVDQNCDGVDGVDADGDGEASEDSGGLDCDDADALTHTMATDLVGDGVDQNCDGVDGLDFDGDGFAAELSGGSDCDDLDADINIGVRFKDIMDGVDSNCDGEDGLNPYGFGVRIVLGTENEIFRLYNAGDFDNDGFEDVYLQATTRDYIFSGYDLSNNSLLTESDALTATDGYLGGGEPIAFSDVDGDGFLDVVFEHDCLITHSVMMSGSAHSDDKICWNNDVDLQFIHDFDDDGVDEIVLLIDYNSGYLGDSIQIITPDAALVDTNQLNVTSQLQTWSGPYQHHDAALIPDMNNDTYNELLIQVSINGNKSYCIYYWPDLNNCISTSYPHMPAYFVGDLNADGWQDYYKSGEIYSGSTHQELYRFDSTMAHSYVNRTNHVDLDNNGSLEYISLYDIHWDLSNGLLNSTSFDVNTEDYRAYTAADYNNDGCIDLGFIGSGNYGDNTALFPFLNHCSP